MGFTALRVLLVISTLFTCLCGASCRQQAKLKLFCADSTRLRNNNGILYDSLGAFTGRLYVLNQSGDSVFSRSYVNGVEHGVHTLWYPDGRIMEVRRYKNGKKSGMSIAHWPGGQKRYEYHFADDLYEGIQYEWFINGALYLKKNYLSGYEHGLQQSWNADGSVRSNYEAKNGRNYGNIGKKNCYSTQKDSVFVSTH